MITYSKNSNQIHNVHNIVLLSKKWEDQMRLLKEIQKNNLVGCYVSNAMKNPPKKSKVVILISENKILLQKMLQI